MVAESRKKLFKIETLGFALAATIISGCGIGNNKLNAGLDETWADFPVQLLRPEESFHILLQSYTTVQEIDTDSTFNLFGIRTTDALYSDRFNLFYVDETDTGVSSLTYKTEFVVNKQEKTVDVYFRTFKPSPSFATLTEDDLTVDEVPGAGQPNLDDDRRIFVGRAKFEAEAFYAKLYLTKKMSTRVAILAAEGFPGHSQLGLSYLNNPEYAMDVPLTSCLEGDGKDCRIITVEGACNGDIMTCAPRTPEATPSQDFMAELNAQNGLEYLGHGVFVFNKAEVPSYMLDFRIAFSDKVEGDPEKLCEDQLSLIKKTPIGDKDNTLCRISKSENNPEVTVENNRLVCALQIEFLPPVDVADHFCEITAKLPGASAQVERIQFIYRD
jgi:hypothetical protein